MWANAQLDGRPAEHRWRPLTPTTWLPCSNAAKTRYPLKYDWVPKPANRSQPLVGRNSPYCKDIWRRYWCLKVFFSIVDICLSCEDIARQICAMVLRWRFLCIIFASCISSEPLHRTTIIRITTVDRWVVIHLLQRSQSLSDVLNVKVDPSSAWIMILVDNGPLKGKECHTPYTCIGVHGAYLPHTLGRWSRRCMVSMDKPQICDAWPVQRQTYTVTYPTS